MSESLWSRFEPAPRLPRLPAPRTSRFTPLRAGIVNLWQYDEQEFRFEQGRLLLRGDNGTGKSKALELLLPFLLDADLSPQRLDPFAGNARTMYWNLLQGDRYDHRVGYVWLELGRRDEEEGAAVEEVWTIGCGLRAARRTQRVDSWYFVTRQRVGLGLSLLSPQRTPLLKDELRKAIGDEGALYETGREYRERLDHLFFHLGPERFAALRHLLLQLRRPQLSQKLDPQSLGELLTESLPPLDADLIGQLSESFERLDQDQRELVRVEAAAREVETFLGVYRDSARGAARRRAAAVRQADSRYHKTAGEVREAEAERARLEERETDLGERRRETEEAVATAGAELKGLEAHEAMRSAEVLRARRERADDLARHAAAADVQQGEAERGEAAATREDERAAAEAREAETERREQARSAETAAGEAGLAAAHAAACEALPQAPSPAEATVRAAIDRGRQGAAELRELTALRDRAREADERAEDRRARADGRWQEGAARTAAARREEERTAGELEGALAAWREELRELALPESGFAALRDLALAPSQTGSPDPAGQLARLAEPQIDDRLREIRDAESALARLAAEERETADERDRVAAARHLGPEPPRTRAAEDRADRPGAPLYLLCDFAEGASEEERAGLEAALEAAGLLDAWVTPGGRLLAPGTLDTVLLPAPCEPGAPTLADLLVPIPDRGVEREEIDAILRSLALAGAEIPPAAAPWVSPEGGWRLGPLQGAWQKSTAEHVGAAAREAARRRRLAELAALLAELDRESREMESRRAGLLAGLERLRGEVAALPSGEPLRRARLAVAAAVGEEERLRGELEAAAGAARAAREALESAGERLARRARELRLAERLGDLPGYLRALDLYGAAFGSLVRATRAAAGAEERRAVAGARLAAAAERRGMAERRAVEARLAAEEARAEVDALEATVGEEARRIVARHAAARERLAALGREEKRLAAEREAAAAQRARAEAEADLHRRELAEREAARQESVAGLRGLAACGLLDLVLDTEDIPAEPAADWPLTRALELARAIERATSEIDLSEEAERRRANRLHERYQALSTDLGADFQPIVRQEGDLILVGILYNGGEQPPASLLALLLEAAEVRRGLLAEHERELLRRFLLGEVGDHLRRRLRQARELVDEMNDQLVRCATASGLVLRLAWRPDAEVDSGLRDAVDLLRRDPDLLPDDGRRRLEAFFQRQIEAARSQWEAVPWRQHLMQALDYRRWHRFEVQRKSGPDGDWQALTRHGHAAISGGEKSVALHLPLFAAAAAHYRSASPAAPRLILLDEAFAGIDHTMRGRCMGLLVDFDLDFMMTSFEEWGCYEELPGLAIYQLYRDPAFEGVAAVPCLWNGRRLAEGVVPGEAPEGA